MPPVSVRIPSWADPQNASVLDDWWTRTARTLGGMLGAADPASQAMAIGAPVELPGGAGGPGQRLLGKAIKAYHGSPHDFDQFSLGKIGTGEGGQAYGHGLYFAENPAVAGTYKFSNQAAPHLVNPTGQIPDDVGQALDRVGRLGFDTRAQALNAVRANPLEWRQTWDVMHPSDQAAADTIDRYAKQFPRGRMYEVNLHASPDELLDWDKPLSQQSPKVQEALKKVGISHLPKPTAAEEQAVFDLAKQRGVAPTSLPEYKALEARLDAASKAERDFPSGGDIYQQLVAPIGRAGHTEGIASQKLKDAGIKGIQYLDQGSRTTGQVVNLHGKYYFSGSSVPYESFAAAEKAAEAMAPRTRNFVIFDDKIIEIAKKYGVALPVAASIYKYQQAQQK